MAATLILRLVKGAPLSFEEGDDNLTALNAEILDLENFLSASVVQLQNVTLTGGVLDSTSATSSLFPSNTVTTLIVGNGTATRTTNIQNGATAAAATNTINIGTGGLASSNTTIVLGSSLGTSTVSARGNLSTTGTFLATSGIQNTAIGNTTRSSGAFTTLAANGATTLTAGTASTTTGTGTLVITGGLGVSGDIFSTSVNVTNIASSTGTYTGTVNFNNGTLATTSATVSLFGTTPTTYNIGGATVASTTNIQTGVTTTGLSKTINIGTGGAAGSTTSITLGSTTGTSSVSVNGALIGSTTATFTSGIQNTAIGNTTRSTGAFTTLTANGAVTFTSGTAATTTTSGALVITGGLGVSGDIYSNRIVALDATSELAGSFRSLFVASSVNRVDVSGALTTSSPNISFTGTDTNVTGTISTKGTGSIVLRTNDTVNQVRVIHTASAVNTLDLSGSITTQPITLVASGTGTNIGINIQTKGSGEFTVNGVPVGGSSSIVDDTTTNATRYVAFTDQTTGNEPTFNVSSTKLTFNPSSGQLDAVSFNTLSDRRKKENIRNLGYTIEDTLRLTGKKFEMKDSGESSIGLIADEVESVIPEVVSKHGSDGFSGVNYQALVSLLIENVKGLHYRIRELERKNVRF